MLRKVLAAVALLAVLPLVANATVIFTITPSSSTLADLTVTGGTNATTGTFDAAASGTGTRPSILDFIFNATTNKLFTTQGANTFGSNIEPTINAGASTLKINGVTVGYPNTTAAGFASTSSPAGGEAKMNVNLSIAPTTGATTTGTIAQLSLPGTWTWGAAGQGGTLRQGSNNSSQSITTVGNWIIASISVGSNSVTLPSVIVGGATSSQNISLTESDGAGNYKISAVTGIDFNVANANTASFAIGSGATNTHAVTYSNTITVGSKTGSITFSTGTFTAPTGTASSSAAGVVGGQSTVALLGAVLDHSNAEFKNVTGAAIGTIGPNLLTLDFGTVPMNAGGGFLDSFFDVFNEITTPGFTAGLDLDALTPGTGHVSRLFRQSGLTTFSNQAAGSGQNYDWRLDTTTPGTFLATYQFKLSDQNLNGATAPESEVLTLLVTGTVLAVVPEPSTFALAALGLAGLGLQRLKKGKPRRNATTRPASVS